MRIFDRAIFASARAVDKLSSVNLPEQTETPPLLAISGPTAAGKSALVLDVCDALASGAGPWAGAEIVSVDSAQVYRGMDIGTAKPDRAARARVPHHLLDILDPAEAYSAARFAADAQAAIAAIRARGHIPLLVGGTLLYFRALFEGLNDLPAANAEFREQLEAEASELGWGVLHARLAQIDPRRAQRLHPNDTQRVQRALEIAHFSGAPASEQQGQPQPPNLPGTIVRLAVMPPDRVALTLRIEARLRQMVDSGFVEEVARLRARGDLHLGLPAMRAVGYRQLWRHLDGDYSLDEAIRLTVIATRQYAKRQMTWLRGEAEKWQWIDPTEPNAAARVLSSVPKSSE
ncbi:MAG: tRNA ((37)-N6)-dimethylallyltransferase MiaA [Nevskia sp.]|nr:tRNA ((37)-N6)-dimethylallyltransferase MiaA [Nevskia sp.]